VLSDEERCALSEGIALTERFCHYMAALARVLSPPIRISTDFRNALSRLVQRFTSSTGVDVVLEISGDLDTLPSAIEAAVLSAAEKGLSEFQPDAHGGAVTLRVVRELERMMVQAQRPEMSYGHARRRFSVSIPIGD
jgi:signal transduction histidine kinase